MEMNHMRRILKLRRAPEESLSMDVRSNVLYVCDPHTPIKDCCLQAWSDGGNRKTGCSAAGAV
eukprot:9371116-Lingulodinium_polyedra.AAC.1